MFRDDCLKILVQQSAELMQKHPIGMLVEFLKANPRGTSLQNILHGRPQNRPCHGRIRILHCSLQQQNFVFRIQKKKPFLIEFFVS